MAYQVLEDSIVEKFTNGRAGTKVHIGIGESERNNCKVFYYFAIFTFSWDGVNCGHFRTELEGDMIQFKDIALARLEKDYPQLKASALETYNEIHTQYPLNL